MDEKVQILVIEDDALVRFFVSEVLDRADYSVTSMSTAEEGLVHLEAGGQPDLAIVDLQLEGMSGMAFLQAVRDAGKSVPALIVTASAGADKATQALALGAVDFVSKPCTAQELREAVRWALDHQTREKHRQALVRCLAQKPDLTVEMARRYVLEDQKL